MKEPSPRLGRGLAALLGEATAAQPTAASGIQPLALDVLEPGPFQPRMAMDPDALAELVESIKLRGVLQPILARPHPDKRGQYQIIAGERRWRASQQAGLHEMPVLVRELSDTDAMAAALVENLQRQDLNALEEADGYRRLVEEFGLTQERLGLAVGKSRSHVANSMRLLNLPPVVQAELRNGRLSAGHARALLAHPDPARAMLAVLSRGLNVRQTEALAAQAVTAETGVASRARQQQSPEIAALEHELAERLGLKVDISFSGTGGTLRIHYRNLDQLDGVIALINRP
jgi:ParB family chromosome partitioning protein